MAHVSANLMEFHAKLEEYRAIENYADVTVECEGKSFKCHRVILAMASNFFHTMFNSGFKESADNEVVLPETNAETFEEIVRFIYTGDVSVTSSNFNSLLEASEFFGLSGISDLCTKFIETHKIGVRKTLNAFSFACKTSKQVLIDRLKQDIVEHFKIFSRVDEFLEISFEEFRTILGGQWSSQNTAELKIDAILRWVSHDQRGRIQHIYDLVDMIRFGNITSDEYIRLVFAKLGAKPNSAGSLTRSLKPASSNDILETSREIELEENSIRVYVRSTEDHSMRVYSLTNEGSEYTITFTPAKNLLNSSPHQWIQSVSLDSYLYRLDFCRRDPNVKPIDQAFSIHTSADMMGQSLNLMPPPLIFGDVSFCALENNIYAYHKTIFRQLVRANSENLTPFDDEEIYRGVYLYNCDLDNWFPVPALKKQVKEAHMVSWNDQILYLINGSDDVNSPCHGQHFQAYDCRVGVWQELPKSIPVHNTDAGCCEYNGKIYVCGDNGLGQRFDPIACEWESLRIVPRIGHHMHSVQLISHSNKLWAVGQEVYGNEMRNNLFVQYVMKKVYLVSERKMYLGLIQIHLILTMGS